VEVLPDFMPEDSATKLQEQLNPVKPLFTFSFSFQQIRKAFRWIFKRKKASN
jgi:hypothetical protein